jgi:hypothetical protein
VLGEEIEAMKRFLMCVVAAFATLCCGITAQAVVVPFDGHGNGYSRDDLAGGGLKFDLELATPYAVKLVTVDVFTSTSDPMKYTAEFVTFALLSESAKLPFTGEVNDNNLITRGIELYGDTSMFTGNPVNGAFANIELPWATTATNTADIADIVMNGQSYERFTNRVQGNWSTAMPGFSVHSEINLIPEPSAIALLGTSSIWLLRRSRRRRGQR